MSFTLRELEAFRGVARLGSFTRAARSLNMSQPALTVRIRHLEDALGVRLLDRTTRSVTLTQVGREFLPIVERVLSEMDAVAVNARELAGHRRGLVTVAALPSIASTVLPATVAEFKIRHPGITVKLRDAVAQRVVALVKSGEADFGIGSPTRRDPELRISHLMDDPVSVALPPGHPLERRARIRLEDLLSSPLILMDREYSVRSLIERAFHSIGRTVVPAYEASYVSTALDLVKADSASPSSRGRPPGKPPSWSGCGRGRSITPCWCDTSACSRSRGARCRPPPSSSSTRCARPVAGRPEQQGRWLKVPQDVLAR
jgi:DNA-binding transcriptional LysR family regulator